MSTISLLCLLGQCFLAELEWMVGVTEKKDILYKKDHLMW